MLKKDFLEIKLQAIRNFQKEYPNSHVGGSFGLFLLGYDLKRDLIISDVDLITPNFDKKNHELSEDVEETSESNDFTYNYKMDFGFNYYVKYDVSINKEQSFQVIEYKGEKYNVSLYENIIRFKKEYAEKGYFKHKADLIAIETGIRPIEPIDTTDCGSLPF